MKIRAGLLIGALVLSVGSGCADNGSTNISVSKQFKDTENNNAGETTPSPTQEIPWSNASIWNSLMESKSSASFSVKINEKLPSLTFRINGTFRDKKFHPFTVEIVDGTDGRVSQRLNVKGKVDNHGEGFSAWNHDLFNFIDLNSDGYLDLRLHFETGATGNNWYATYLYQPKTKKYKYHEDLSILSGITVDSDSNVIKTYWRGGWCVECREYYRIDKSDKLILDMLEWTKVDRINTDSGCRKYTGVPRDKRATYLGYAFYNMDGAKFEKFIRTRVKIVNEEELQGSLLETRYN